MNNITILTSIALLMMMGITKPASAQSYQTDAGAIVIEDGLLLSSYKQLIFVMAKNISQPTRIELHTITSEGVVNNFAPLNFPQGLVKGQIIPLWNGELNSFHTTPWFRFGVSIITQSEIYYSQTITPVNYREQYKEPLLTSISELGGFGAPYTITARGVFDTTEPMMILINTKVFITQKAITKIAPGIIQFTVPSDSSAIFPAGKYLLTLCQSGHCDTMTGRHR